MDKMVLATLLLMEKENVDVTREDPGWARRDLAIEEQILNLVEEDPAWVLDKSLDKSIFPTALCGVHEAGAIWYG